MITMITDSVKIIHDPRGYYTLMVNGQFKGNFDTMKEAVDEADMVLAWA